MTRAEPVSLRDVARRAGVSRTTVSHALSGNRPVAPATASRIRAVVEELGYVPYAAARALQSRRSRVIGLVVPDVSNAFFGAIATGVERYANGVDYGVVLCTSQGDPQRERRYLGMVRSGALDGLLYDAADLRADDPLPAIAGRFPLVFVDEEVPAASSAPVVTSDHRRGGRIAAQHLAGLGHAEVAVLSGPPALASSRERTEGFCEVFPRARILVGDYSEAAGRRLAAVLARRHPSVTAVFAGNDLMAFGLLERLRALGIDVPGEISVVGFDDVDAARRATPAGLLLDHLLAGAALGPRRVSVPVRLIVRGSTAPVRRSG